jgi:hypothetical protein
MPDCSSTAESVAKTSYLARTGSLIFIAEANTVQDFDLTSCSTTPETLRPEGRIVSTIVHHGELADVLGTVDRTPPTVAPAGAALDVQ